MAQPSRATTGSPAQAGSAGLRLSGEALASTLPSLLVAANRVAATVAQGVHGRRRVGAGEAFWQFRRYDIGDPIARIDWRQSAKTAHVFVRENEWEAAQTVYLWHDSSPSMRWRSAETLPQKEERARLLLVALASLLTRAGERVALIGDATPPGAGAATVSRLAEALLLQNGGDGLPPPQRLPRHAQSVLIGDFLVPEETLRQRLSLYVDTQTRGHILQVLDPAEEDLPYEGRIEFADIESGEKRVIPRVGGIREAYTARLAALRETLTDIARQARWTISFHRTDRPPQAALLALYTALAEGV
jgi:uncharacterized protein (DUF58 family)